MKYRKRSKISQNGKLFVELPALQRIEKSPKTYNGRNSVATLVTSFLIGSSSFLQISRTGIKFLDELEFRLDPNTDYGIICH